MIDFTHFVAGPMTTMMLADFGADVVKIEKPGNGDDFRAVKMTRHDRSGAPFLWANRNKRSIVLDLESEKGVDIAKRLIAEADVVVENFSSGVMERMGLDYESVATSNPGLIYCSISAAGRSGPLANRAGFDPVTQAESGYMKISGKHDGAAVTSGAPIIDMTTAMMACNTVLAALVARSHLGKGQFVEVSLFDQGITMLGYHAMTHLMTGEDPWSVGSVPSPLPAVDTFDTADRAIFICCANDRTYQRLVVEVLERPDLCAGEFERGAGRVKHCDELNEAIGEVLSKQDCDHWLAKMRDAGVPAGAVETMSAALSSPEVAQRQLLSQIPHPVHGQIPNIALPFRLHTTPVVDPTSAPTLGQHCDEVLGEVLGLQTEDIATLREQGAFGSDGAGR